MDHCDLNNIEEKEMLPGFHAKMLHTENMPQVLWCIKKGSELPAHEHPHEQVATVNEGEFELTINGDVQVLKAGMVAAIPGDTIHSGRALTDCQMTVVFYPVREDLK